MLKSIGVIIVYLIISYFQVLQLLKAKMVREIWVFSLLIVFISVLSILKLNNVSIPNPLNLVSIILNPIVRMYE